MIFLIKPSIEYPVDLENLRESVWATNKKHCFSTHVVKQSQLDYTVTIAQTTLVRSGKQKHQQPTVRFSDQMLLGVSILRINKVSDMRNIRGTNTKNHHWLLSRLPKSFFISVHSVVFSGSFSLVLRSRHQDFMRVIGSGAKLI